MSNNMKVFLALLFFVGIFLTGCLVGYKVGYNWGNTDGRFKEIIACYEDIQVQEKRHKLELKECK